jgi:two-component system OmpR family response regulator
MRVLVVEDSEDLSRALRTVLVDAGYAVDQAHDGEEAVFQMREVAYDAVVLDVLLPLRDGWSVLQEARAAGVKTPVVMLTARDELADRIRGLDLGADDYLTKPFAPSELVARLRAVIRRSYGAASESIALGDVTVDTASRQVIRSGLAVSLTPREYAIFELLARRRGTLVTRTDIYERIYDRDTDLLSNAIDVHVASLRRKIPDVDIRTRRGEGYVLVA